MFAKILLLCVAASALARPDAPGYQYQEPTTTPKPYGHGEHEKSEPFEFEYNVKDEHENLDFGHSADSDGEVITGTYHVLLPDGRIQTVRYTADWKNGFHADIEYEGEAKVDEPDTLYGPPDQKYGTPNH